MEPTFCAYCGVPTAGTGLLGRDRADRPTPAYCCAGCLSLGERSGSEKRSIRLDPLWIRVGVAAVLAAQTTALGLAINLTPPSGPAKLVLQSIVLVATLIVLALLGGPLFVAAFRQASLGVLSTDALFLLGIVGALVASIRSMIRGEGPIYFEVVSAISLVHALNKIFGARRRATALDATKAWTDRLKTCRRIGENGRFEAVGIDSIAAGDVVEIWPGEWIAIDGEIVEGEAFVRESHLTGEALSVVRKAGDRVWAGTACEDAVLRIRALSPGTQRRVDRLIESVERARLSPTTLQGQADRLARVFAPIVIAVSLGTFAVWSIRASWDVALFHAMSVLLVACPCALGLATPIAIWTALGKFAERGLVVEDGAFVERLASVDDVVLDKTGTLTEPEFAPVDFATISFDRARLSSWVAAVEARGAHPIARGLAKTLANRTDVADEVEVLDHRLVAGKGVAATIREVKTGATFSIEIGREEGSRPEDEPARRDLFSRLRVREACQIIFVTIDGRLRGIAALRESARATAADCLDQLRALGLSVTIMTGDSKARAIAAGFETAEAGLSPEEKRSRVLSRRSRGLRTLFVGDGINDAPALAAAHASIALAGGAEIAVEAASAALYGGDLSAVPWAIALARRTVRVVRSSIFLAAGYNVLGMTLAALGLLHPVAASLLMAASSLLTAWRAAEVGRDDECGCRQPSPTVGVSSKRSVVLGRLGAACLFAQGPLSAALAGLSSFGFLLATALFAVPAVRLAWSVRLRRAVETNMFLGMAIFGNFGMLLGWWFDAGFRPVTRCGCGFEPGSFVRSAGMWLGMLIGCHIPSIGSAVKERLSGSRRLETILGDLGMILGMALAGAWVDLRLPPGNPARTVYVGFAAMSSGMLIGMWAGHRLVCSLKHWSSRREAPIDETSESALGTEAGSTLKTGLGV